MQLWGKFRKRLSRILIPVLRTMPPALALRAAGVLGRIGYLAFPPTRARFDRAVTWWNNHFETNWNISEVARSLASNELRWQLRDVLLDDLTPAQFDGLFEVVGREHLDDAIARGRGVVLLGNHFGAHLQAAHWLLKREYPLRIYMERPRRISSLLSDHFDLDGPLGQTKLFISRSSDMVESAGSILRATRILGARMVLMMASDVRWEGSNTVTAEFLGQEYRFSATWAFLAGMMRSPVVPVFSQILPDGRYRVEFLSAWEVPTTHHADAQEAWVRKSLEVIESWVRRDPSNCNEYARWLETASAGAPRRRTAAA